MSTLPDSEIEAMARTFTEGYRLGFEAAGIDLSKKKNCKYPIFPWTGEDDKSRDTAV